MVPAALLTALLLAPPLAQERPAAEVPSSASHAIGPEDVLRITVYGHEDLTQTVVVQPDGTFVFPLLGRVEAAGLTPRELEQSLVTRLEDGFVRAPQVAVVIQALRSSVVYVMGEVTRPGSVPLPNARTLVEALTRAGPLLGTAGSEVRVLRAGGSEVVPVDMRDLQAGLAGANLALRPGDTVLVPRAAHVYVTGAVRKPGSYGIAPGTTVRQVVGLAGGFTKRAQRTVRLVRKTGGRATELKAGLDDPVQADDTLVVGGGSF